MNKKRIPAFITKDILKLSFVFCVFFTVNHSINAQSTDQNFPTPITSNEISGTIKARDVGDSRLTGHFYTFNGNQGDVFINVVTNNFNGDIDIFNAVNLNPLTKIVVYADSSASETGRIVYLRKTEKLIIRIQGRTPNDEPATYTVKFAGSFQPALAADYEQPKQPEVKAESKSDVIVNSVGTIIGVKPKPSPSPAEEIAKTEEIKEEKTSENKAELIGKVVEEPKNDKIKKPDVIITESKTEAPAEANEKSEKTESAKASKPAKTLSKTRTKNVTKTAKPEPKSAAPNPLENVRLIVEFKNGSKIERSMSEVLRVNVDNKGTLTIVSKDGSIGRYSILEVAKMTIE